MKLTRDCALSAGVVCLVLLAAALPAGAASIVSVDVSAPDLNGMYTYTWTVEYDYNAGLYNNGFGHFELYFEETKLDPASTPNLLGSTDPNGVLVNTVLNADSYGALHPAWRTPLDITLESLEQEGGDPEHGTDSEIDFHRSSGGDTASGLYTFSFKADKFAEVFEWELHGPNESDKDGEEGHTPEPCSLALLALGLGGTWLVQRRRKA
jgi:hypothetical protein